MTQVVLIRPGATLFDEQRRIQGVLDVPLSTRGQEEVQLLAEDLAGCALETIYHGPCSSAVATAEQLADRLSVPCRRLEGLRNLDQGLWQGLQVCEVKRRNGKMYRRWVEDPLHVCPPLGESVDEAVRRIETVLRPLLRRHRGRAFGLVVPEPLCTLIARHLRAEPLAVLDEPETTGSFERVEIPELVGRRSGWT